MHLVKANCRVQFTADDLDFITSTLGKAGQSNSALLQLLTDPETRDLILDNEALYHALLEHSGCLRVSSHFYFYIMVRNVLRRAGITDVVVADYVAEMLTEYSSIDQTRCVVPGQPQASLEYFFEMLAALRTADDRTSFCIRAHIGNHSLFLSGIFLNRIKYRSEYRGFPDISYYEGLGQASFKMAGDHRLAARYELGPVFSLLSDQFRAARLALNDLTDRVLCVGEPDAGIAHLLRM